MSDTKIEELNVQLDDLKINNDQVEPEYSENTSVLPDNHGFNGPDQVLPADSDVTSVASGRVLLHHDPSEQREILSIPGLLSRMAKKYPNHPALVSRPRHDGYRKIYTYQDYETTVRIVAKAFIYFGLERHHGVAILGFNSPQWFICDLAAIYAGGIATGIYTTNSMEACYYCADYSKANIIVVDDETQLEKIFKIRKQLPNLKALIQFDGVPGKLGVFSWNDVLRIGRSQPDAQLNAILKTIAVNECCTLVFTSGTVGQPKAVMLSHDNFISTARISKETHQFKEAYEVLVSYLPLSHVAAQMADLIMSLTVAATVHFADKDALKGSLIDTLIFVKPTTFLGVPRVWEKFYENLMEMSDNNNIIKSIGLQWLKLRGLSYNMNKMNGIDTKPWGYSLAKMLLFDKVKEKIGLDKCKLFLTGGAPLRDDIKKYFMSIDILLIELYGMSECTGAHVYSTNDKFKLGSIGKVPKQFEIKLDAVDVNGEGEICMRGPHVFMGYLNDPDKTKEAVDDKKWLHTGDLGKIDDDGFVYITGRIKELIITSGGENIAPLPIEEKLLQEIPALSNVMLIGDEKKFLSVFFTFKSRFDVDTSEPTDYLSAVSRSWLASIGSPAKTVSDIILNKDPAVYQQLENAINKVNEVAVSNAQRIQKFKVLPFDFSISTGELGPTLKIKRRFVAEKYKYLIDEMYQC